MVAGLPLEVLGDVSDEVGLSQNLDAAYAVEGCVDVFFRILPQLLVLLAESDPLLVEPRTVAVEAVEVHGLVDGRGERGGPADSRNQGLVVVHQRVQLRAFGEEGCLEICFGTVVGVHRAVAVVVDVQYRAVLEAFVGIVGDCGKGAEVIAGLDDIGLLPGRVEAE